MSIVRWEQPPSPTPGGPGKGKPVIAHELIAIQLRQRPGEWALIVEGYTHSSMGSLISRGKIRPYAPAGDYEAVARAVNGAHNIYARYVGPRCQEPTCPDYGDPDFGEATCPAEHAEPRTAAGHPAHLATAETRPCDNEREPNGDRCTGTLTYAPGDVQAKCPACGGWTGRFAPVGHPAHTPGDSQ